MDPELMDDLLGEYISETQERLDRIGDLLLHLESDETPDITVVRREIHTLKGNSAAFGLEDVSELCHIMEDHFDLVGERSGRIDFQAAFDACDFLAAHTDALAQGESPPVVSEAIRNAFLSPAAEAGCLTEAAACERPASAQPAPGGAAAAVAQPAVAVAEVNKAAVATEPQGPAAAAAIGQQCGVHAESQAMAREESAIEASQGTSRRFLIVDDIEANRSLLVDILEDFGECVEAENGLAAVAAFEASLLENKPFAAILLDIWMPELDGHTTLERIRSIEHQHRVYGSAGVKVVMVTAEERERHTVRAFKTGCQSYLVKPVKATAVRRELAKLGALGAEHTPRRHAYRFRDDVQQVGIRSKNGSYQLAEVIDESRRDIRVYAEEVSWLRPDATVSIDYLDAPMQAVVRTIEPQTEDHRYPVEFEWL